MYCRTFGVRSQFMLVSYSCFRFVVIYSGVPCVKVSYILLLSCLQSLLSVGPYVLVLYSVLFVRFQHVPLTAVFLFGLCARDIVRIIYS